MYRSIRVIRVRLLAWDLEVENKGERAASNSDVTREHIVFKLATTFSNPASSQSGMPPIGAGAQISGPASPQPEKTAWFSSRPVKGIRSWLSPSKPESMQRGYPSPENGGQRRPAGSMPNVPPLFGGVAYVETPYYSRGANAYVPNTGKVLTNPIGAGIVASYRPQASYGPAAQYADGAIWWSSQVIPTSIDLQGLTDPAALAAILDPLQIQAVVRVG